MIEKPKYRHIWNLKNHCNLIIIILYLSYFFNQIATHYAAWLFILNKKKNGSYNTRMIVWRGINCVAEGLEWIFAIIKFENIPYTD